MTVCIWLNEFRFLGDRMLSVRCLSVWRWCIVAVWLNGWMDPDETWRVGKELVTTRLVLATVISRLDYCNAALAGLPQVTVAPLQRGQNSAARLIFKLSSREHVTPCLRRTVRMKQTVWRFARGGKPSWLSKTAKTLFLPLLIMFTDILLSWCLFFYRQHCPKRNAPVFNLLRGSLL